MLSVMLYPCILCVALLMDVHVDSVCELFGETIRNMFGCGCYNVVECYGVFSVCGGALLDRPCMVFQSMCVVCCDPSVLLSVPSIDFVYVLVCQKLSPHLRVRELDHRRLLSLCWFFV